MLVKQPDSKRRSRFTTDRLSMKPHILVPALESDAPTAAEKHLQITKHNAEHSWGIKTNSAGHIQRNTI